MAGDAEGTQTADDVQRKLPPRRGRAAAVVLALLLADSGIAALVARTSLAPRGAPSVPRQAVVSVAPTDTPTATSTPTPRPTATPIPWAPTTTPPAGWAFTVTVMRDMCANPQLPSPPLQLDDGAFDVPQPNGTHWRAWTNDPAYVVYPDHDVIARDYREYPRIVGPYPADHPIEVTVATSSPDLGTWVGVVAPC